MHNMRTDAFLVMMQQHKISGVLHQPFRMCRVITIARRVPGFD